MENLFSLFSCLVDILVTLFLSNLNLYRLTLLKRFCNFGLYSLDSWRLLSNYHECLWNSNLIAVFENERVTSLCLMHLKKLKVLLHKNYRIVNIRTDMNTYLCFDLTERLIWKWVINQAYSVTLTFTAFLLKIYLFVKSTGFGTAALITK